MDGYQICKLFKQNSRLKDIPVIFIISLDAMESKVKAFHMGGVDYITRPFHFEEAEARVRTHTKLHLLHKRRLYQKVMKKMRELLLAQQATIFAIAKLAAARDEDTGKHPDQVFLKPGKL